MHIDRDRYQAACEAWTERFPNHCRKCGGTGGTVIPSTYWEPEDFYECSACMEKGICPICAGELTDDGRCKADEGHTDGSLHHDVPYEADFLVG